MKRLDSLHWTLIAILLAGAVLGILTPYKYEKMGQRVVRINRLSSEADMLTISGWRALRPSKESTGTRLLLESEENKARAYENSIQTNRSCRSRSKNPDHFMRLSGKL
jgi:hypothetical protein